MSLGIKVICLVTYCYVDFVVMATEVELYSYSYGKDWLLPWQQRNTFIRLSFQGAYSSCFVYFFFWSTWRSDKT